MMALIKGHWQEWWWTNSKRELVGNTFKKPPKKLLLETLQLKADHYMIMHAPKSFF